MQVKIARIIDQDIKPHSLVEFETPYGSAIAYWYGAIPNVVQIYDVEVEIEDLLVWDETVIDVDERKFFVNHQNEYLVLQGEIETISADGIVDLRLGSSIISFETTGEFSKAPKAYVRIYAKRAVLYNTNL